MTTTTATSTATATAKTATDHPVAILSRLDIDATAPAFTKALATLDAASVRELDGAGIEPGLRDLIRLRASQRNGCAYCVAEHTRDALAAGETIARVAAVTVWRESPFFTARERSAFALTDTMTPVAASHVPDADWREAAAALNPAELSAVVALVVAINAWNAVGVTTRAWTPTP